MNNICVDFDRGVVTVEGKDTTHVPSMDGIAALLVDVLDTLAYGGETVCLETKRDGRYREVGERWGRIDAR